MANPQQRVLLWGTQNKYTTTEAGATVGADLGVNFYYNGVLVRPEDILNLDPAENPQFPITLWRQIQEIPPNVTALAETNTTGLYVITGPGGSETRTIMGPLSVEVTFGDGVTGNPTLQLTNDALDPGTLRYYRTDADGVKGWTPILPGEVPTDLATYLTDPDGNFLSSPDGSSFLTSDQPDALMTGMEWSSSGGYLEVTPEGGEKQTLVAFDSKIVNVYRLADLPVAIAGVINLANSTSYYITTHIDLDGARFNCGTNVGLFGDSASNCSLTSTGLGAGIPLITSASALNMESITIHDVDTALDLNDAFSQLNWENIVFNNVPNVGTIQNYANIVWGQCVLQDSANLVVSGTQGSLAFFECLFDGRPGQTTLTVPSSAVITRRIRMLYCGVTCLPGETAFNISASATIPDEGYVLDNVAFTGGGTYLAGLDHTSNKSDFFKCTGITNSTALCAYSMTANATATVIGATGTFVKVAGTTIPSSFNQKFSTATTQRALYAGARTNVFRAVAFASMQSGNNQTLRMRIAVNGVTVSASNSIFKTTGSGDASAIGCQALIQLAPGDYVEVFVTNDTAANDITVTDLSFTIVRQD